MGTEADFKALTKEADKYGLHIIVDAVVNHTTSDVAAVSPKIKALGNGLMEMKALKILVIAIN